MNINKGDRWYSLVPSNPEGILYDVTHDNPSYYESRTHMDCLSKSALLGFSGCFLGSTKGFDEFFENKISVVNEKRLYKIHIENTGNSMISLGFCSNKLVCIKSARSRTRRYSVDSSSRRKRRGTSK